jgi:hypothetical protein
VNRGEWRPAKPTDGPVGRQRWARIEPQVLQHYVLSGHWATMFRRNVHRNANVAVILLKLNASTNQL